MAGVVVPRSFKLLDELEQAEKGKYDAGKYGNAPQFISIGLAQPDDILLKSWNCTLIPAQGTPIGDRFYALTIVTDENYPHVPPRVKFSQRVAISCVDGSGNVNVASIPGFQWRYEKSMMDDLVALRQHKSSSSVSRACAAVQGDY